MKNASRNIWTKRTAQLAVAFTILLVLFGSGCSVTAPKLTAEGRKRDIQYLAHWVRDCHPFIELSEKKWNIPDYEELLPRYLKFAEQAETHEEFYQVTSGYFRLIGSCGHFNLLDEETLKIWKIEPRNRYNFKGDLYFLMSQSCFSATDNLLNEVKRIGLATLVGRNTGGGGAGYLAPAAVILPSSEIAFRVETELVINPDGSVNEPLETPPDIGIEPADPPKSITKEDLLKDKWIEHIIHKL